MVTHGTKPVQVCSVGTRLPGRIRVLFLHFPRDSGGVHTKVLLVDAALLVDNEGHDTALAIRSRPGDERETCDHISIDDIAVLASGRVFAREQRMRCMKLDL
jgi:hypothetical protein